MNTEKDENVKNRKIKVIILSLIIIGSIAPLLIIFGIFTYSINKNIDLISAIKEIWNIFLSFKIPFWIIGAVIIILGIIKRLITLIKIKIKKINIKPFGIYRILKIITGKFTIMFIPHSERQILNLHISYASLIFMGCIFFMLIFGFFYLSTQFTNTPIYYTYPDFSKEVFDEEREKILDIIELIDIHRNKAIQERNKVNSFISNFISFVTGFVISYLASLAANKHLQVSKNIERLKKD